MPRPKNVMPTTNLDLYIRADLVQQVKDRLYDPRLGKTAYGAIGTLVTQLLSKWVEETPLHPTVKANREKEQGDVAEQL